VEHFTNYSRAESNAANDYLDNLYDTQVPSLNPGDTSDFFKIEYHVGNPGLDSLFQYNPADPAARALHYGVSQPPVAVMDGILGQYYSKAYFDGTYTDINAEEIERRALEDPEFNITIVPDVGAPASVIRADVTLDYQALNSLSDDVVLQLVLVETDVPVDDVSGRRFRNVARKALMGANGRTLVKSWTTGTTHTESVDVTLDVPIRDGNKLNLVAWVEHKVTGRIYQSVVIPSAPKTGVQPVGLEDDPIASEIRDILIYPNPASRALKFSLDHELSRDYGWRLIDQRGITVLDGAVNRTFSSPQEVDIQQLANGVYFLQILSGATPIIHRKIAVMNQQN
jgi:hypothetical protein